MTGNKFIINQNGEIEDTMAHITFDSFMEILIVLNGQSRQLKKLSEENEQLTPFLNIARDYNLTLDQLYGVLEETLEEK